MRKVITGNQSVAYGVMLTRPEVIAAYPITPQTTIIEEIANMTASGMIDADYIRVESEHSAMAACIGASMGGVRTFTATAGQGLMLMHEMLHYAAGARLPVVMANVNRGVAPPWSIWSDQTDSLAQRDTGWVQLYCECNQEVLDTTIMAFKIAEQIRLPVMVVLDAFFLSHTAEPVDIPDIELIDKFLPKYDPGICGLTPKIRELSVRWGLPLCTPKSDGSFSAIYKKSNRLSTKLTKNTAKWSGAVTANTKN